MLCASEDERPPPALPDDLIMHILALDTAPPFTYLDKATQLARWPKATVTAMLRRRMSVQAALNKAARAGLVAVVQHMLLSATPRAKADHSHSMALWDAAKGGHVAVCRLLLTQPDHPSKANAFGSAALQMAAEEGHLEVCQLLLQWPDNPARADDANSAALLKACAAGHVDVAGLLLSQPERVAIARAEDSAALAAAAGRADLQLCKLLLSQPQHAAHAADNNSAALVAAAGTGNTQLCMLLLSQPQHAAVASDQHSAALTAAAHAGAVDVCELLLTWPDSPAVAGDDDNAPLMAAVSGNHPHVAKLLLARSAPVTKAALNAALSAGSVPMCQVLLTHCGGEDGALSTRGQVLVDAIRCDKQSICQLIFEQWPEAPASAEDLADALRKSLEVSQMPLISYMIQKCRGYSGPQADIVQNAVNQPAARAAAELLAMQQANTANARSRHFTQAMDNLVQVDDDWLVRRLLRQLLSCSAVMPAVARWVVAAATQPYDRTALGNGVFSKGVDWVFSRLFNLPEFDGAAVESACFSAWHAATGAAAGPQCPTCTDGAHPHCTALACACRTGCEALWQLLLDARQYTAEELLHALRQVPASHARYSVRLAFRRAYSEHAHLFL